MSESHVISGLKMKQHEIRMRISDLEDQIKACRKDLTCIGEALRICGDPDGYYVKPEALFGRGDLARVIFDALRQSPEGLDLHSLIAIVAKANSIDLNDSKLAPIVKTRVNNALYRYMHKREVLNRKGPHGTRVWKITP